jgi:group I intron endonuclease
MKNWVIYKLVSPSGRIYVGKTSNLKRRIIHYKGLFCKAQPLLYKSLLKYGFYGHEFTVLEEFEGDVLLSKEREMFWILENKSNKSRFPNHKGLNLTDGGEGFLGYKYSDYRKKKMSEYQKKHPNSGQFKKGTPSPNKGKKSLHPAWNKGKKCDNGRTGMKFSGTEEERYRIYVKPQLDLKKECFWKGKKMPKYAVEKMAATKIGKSNFKVKKEISQYTLTGLFIKKYTSLSEASQETGISKQCIIHYAKGRLLKKPRYPFVFRYHTEPAFSMVSFERRTFKQQEIKVV